MPERRRSREIERLVEALILRLTDAVESATSARGRVLTKEYLHAAMADVLQHLGLVGDAPEFHPARPPPQTELSLGDEPAVFYPDPPAPDDFAA